MAHKIRVLCGPVPSYAAAKVASLLRSRDPLNSGPLVRCCEGGLLSNSTSVVRLFVIFAFVMFFCLLAPLLIPTSPYSIEQYNMRD